MTPATFPELFFFSIASGCTPAFFCLPAPSLSSLRANLALLTLAFGLLHIAAKVLNVQTWRP